MKRITILVAVALACSMLFPAAALAHRPLSKSGGTVESTVKDLKSREFTKIKLQGYGTHVSSVTVSKSWKDSWYWNSNKTQKMYNEKCIIIVTRTFKKDKDAIKFWLTYWHQKGVGPKWGIAKGMNVSYGESRWNKNCVSKSGKYVGAFQMDPDWGSVSQRKRIEYAARRFMKACEDGSADEHWSDTW